MKKIWLILFLTANILAQTNDDYLIITKVKFGAIFPGLTSYYFSDDPSRLSLLEKAHPVFPGFSAGIGIESPVIISIYNANLSLALETSYGLVSTHDVETYYGKSKFTITSLPVLFWAIIKSKGKIAPFVRLGIGTERTQFIEKYYSNNQSDFNLKEWFFSWGIGAGIDLNFYRYKISLFVDAIVKEGGITKQFSDRREINYDFRNGVSFGGIQIGYAF